MPVTRFPWLLVVALLASVMLVGCDDDKPRRRPAEGPPPEPTGPDPVLEKWDLLGENPRYKPLSELYTRYAEAKVDDLANPMLPNLVLFTPRPIIEKRDEDDPMNKGCGVPGKPACSIIEEEDDKPVDPRARRPLADYKVIMLMTGTARPKALVTDSLGGRFTLERGDPLGQEGGRVKAILQYKMLVGVPGQADPYVFSLEPPLSELASEGEEAEQKQEF
ncbi:MAG: hypothetical protein RIT45_348 [Pseudomonadota bacterium]|jgi:hypothetical protein